MLKHLLSLESLLKYLLATVLIFVPLYPKFPLIRVPGAFISIRLEDFLLGLCFVFLILIIKKEKYTFFKNRLYQAIFFYLLVGLVSLFSAVFLTQTVAPHIGFLHWARRIEYFTPLFLTSFLLKKKPELCDFYLKILKIIVFTAFVYGFGQRYFSWPIIITQNEEYSKGVALRWVPGSHINSTFAGHYDLATFLVMVIPIIISLISLISKNTQRAYLFGVFLAGLWLLVSSASRISLLSYLFSSTLSLIILKRYKLIPLLVIVSVLFTGFSPNLLARYKRFYEVTIQKVKFNRLIYGNFTSSVYASELTLLPKRQVDLTPTPTPVFEDRSSNIRINVEWPRALRAFAKNPLLGTGYSSITLATDNDFLRLLGETGILGFFAFALIFFRLIIEFMNLLPLRRLKNSTNKAFFVGLVSSLPGVMINAFFIDVFEASKFAIIFWFLFGMALGLFENEESEKFN